jgi:serine/threonine protein kinase
LPAAHAAQDEHGHVDPIIHRDVSPHNVMLSSDGATKLADFGIAKPQSMVGSTKPGDLKGLPSDALVKEVSRDADWRAATDAFLMP